MKFWNSYTKEEKSWILYDWANSAYSLIIVTAILPIFFKAVAESGGLAGHESTSIWGYANSAATLVVSLAAPILGTIGDFRGMKKRLFLMFALLGILATFGLAVVPLSNWSMLLAVYILSHIGFQAANIFYDGFLVDITSDERMDYVSSSGYGFGYIGSAILYIFVMVLQVTDGFGLADTATVTRFCFLLTGLWWLGFSWPFLKNVHQHVGLAPVKHPIKTSFQQLRQTLGDIRQYRKIMLFLIAYFFYIDGVDTIFTMASAFGVDMGLTMNQLIIILLVINVIAFPFTLIYGKLTQRFGTKKMILTAISVYVVICVYALFMTTIVDFIILGILVGTSQGGIQALSRSYFASIIPKEKASEFFGFYNIFGKFSAILGPVIFGIATSVFGNSKYGVASLIVLFVVGGLLFSRLQQED